MDDRFYLARRSAGLSLSEAARLCGVTERTIRHWDRSGAPPGPYNTARLAAGFPYGPDWENWRFYRGMLWSPEGVSFTPGEIRAIPYQTALINELRRSRENGRADPNLENVVLFPGVHRNGRNHNA